MELARREQRVCSPFFTNYEDGCLPALWGKNLILDAKYYGKVLQKQFDKYTLHSGDLYQIFSYVKNQDRENTGNVSGVLVYAKTDEEISFDECMFNVSGNQIGARTLNLNQDFKSIAAQLDSIAEYFFGRVDK